jgi:hypothetical protein
MQGSGYVAGSAHADFEGSVAPARRAADADRSFTDPKGGYLHELTGAVAQGLPRWQFDCEEFLEGGHLAYAGHACLVRDEYRASDVHRIHQVGVFSVY